MTKGSQSLALRAAFAVLLTLGFYLLALSITALLLYIPYAEWTYGGRLHVKILIFCLLGAGVILKSIIPRPDRFVAPGPLLSPDEQPELFAMLREVADKMGQPLPAEVYALPEMNAWVMDRGGILGFGSKRVMGLGLPLLQVLNVSQARGVIAHEFGHFYGGDTRLGPWIYRTRSAIMRTLESLAGHSSLLQQPFVWYAKAFMAITQAISRGQEFTADRLAAGIVGSQAMIEGLQAVHGGAAVFDAYWRNEYAPTVDKGFWPPFAKGFGQFSKVPRIADAAAHIVAEELNSGKTGRYDSHPSLKDRVLALRQLALDGEQRADKAISLVCELEKLEATLLGNLCESAKIPKGQAIRWDQVGSMVWLPLWQEQLDSHREVLEEVRLQELPGILADPDLKGRLLKGSPSLEERAQNHFLEGLLGAAVTIFLSRQGWQLQMDPGRDVSLSREGSVLFPFIAIRQLLTKDSAADSWTELSAAAGGDLVLGSV